MCTNQSFLYISVTNDSVKYLIGSWHKTLNLLACVYFLSNEMPKLVLVRDSINNEIRAFLRPCRSCFQYFLCFFVSLVYCIFCTLSCFLCVVNLRSRILNKQYSWRKRNKNVFEIHNTSRWNFTFFIYLYFNVKDSHMHGDGKNQHCAFLHF